jgi:hypothetical protein
MYYHEKRNIASIVAGLLVLAAYCIYAFGGAGASAGGDLKFWGGTILIFIGIGIAANIVIQIIYHIGMSAAIAIKKGEGNEKAIDKEIKATMVEDEMDKLIELKSERACFIAAGIGFIAGMLALVLGASAAVMINILFLAGSAGSVAVGFTSLYFYRKGVRNA